MVQAPSTADSTGTRNRAHFEGRALMSAPPGHDRSRPAGEPAALGRRGRRGRRDWRRASVGERIGGDDEPGNEGRTAVGEEGDAHGNLEGLHPALMQPAAAPANRDRLTTAVVSLNRPAATSPRRDAEGLIPRGDFLARYRRTDGAIGRPFLPGAFPPSELQAASQDAAFFRRGAFPRPQPPPNLDAIWSLVFLGGTSGLLMIRFQPLKL
jgi:hypothetical protein